MSFHDYCADWFIAHLERDIEAHETGRYDEIGLAFDDAPDWTLDEENDKEGFERLATAYNFWDSWIDARNNDWHHYPGVEKDDWPITARQICRGLRENWEPERMMENAVFNPPPATPRQSWWQRFKRVFGGE